MAKGICIGLVAGAVGCVLVLPFPAAEAGNTKENVLHSFGNGTDGAFRVASLINVKGTLYGTTGEGGTSQECNPAGCGTVFALSLSTRAEKVIYSFCSAASCTDGGGPGAGLIHVNGALYGTTAGGGAYGFGTVFKLHPGTGVEKVLHSFCRIGGATDAGELVLV